MKGFILVFLLFPLTAHSQKVLKDKIDDFTKSHIIETSWEKLLYSWNGISYYRIRAIDSTILFDLKYMNNSKIYYIEEKSELLLKFDNDSIIALNCFNNVIGESA